MGVVALLKVSEVIVVERDCVFLIESFFLEGESSMELSVRERASIFLTLPGVDGDLISREGLPGFEFGDSASKMEDKSFACLGVTDGGASASSVVEVELTLRCMTDEELVDPSERPRLIPKGS